MATPPNSAAALVLGIISFFFCWLPVMGLTCGIIGAALAGKGLREYRLHSDKYSGNGMLVTGNVFSIIGIVVSAIVLFFSIIALIVAGSVSALFWDL